MTPSAQLFQNLLDGEEIPYSYQDQERHAQQFAKLTLDSHKAIKAVGRALMHEHVWAITGGLASGKSTTGKLLYQRGYKVISADDLARQVTEIGHRGHLRIAQYFGTGFFDDQLHLQRRALRSYIFDHPKERKLLESLLHPLIAERLWQELIGEVGTAGAPLGPIIFYEVPLLFEKDNAHEFRGVIVVTCPEDSQKSRLINRDRISPPRHKRLLAPKCHCSLKSKKQTM